MQVEAHVSDDVHRLEQVCVGLVERLSSSKMLNQQHYNIMPKEAWQVPSRPKWDHALAFKEDSTPPALS